MPLHSQQYLPLETREGKGSTRYFEEVLGEVTNLTYTRRNKYE